MKRVTKNAIAQSLQYELGLDSSEISKMMHMSEIKVVDLIHGSYGRPLYGELSDSERKKALKCAEKIVKTYKQNNI